MKKLILYLFAITTGLISISFPLQAQHDFSRLSAHFEDLRLVDILDQIEARTQYRFFYNRADLSTRRFSYSFEETPVNQIVEKLLTPTTLGYVFFYDYAFVLVPENLARRDFSMDYYKAREQATREGEEKPSQVVGDLNQLEPSGIATLTGRVIDDQTNDPIVGASVAIKNLDLGTITDHEGKFALEVTAGIHYINVSYVGYEDINRSLRVLSSGNLTYRMAKGAINLEEVVVSARASEGGIDDAQISITTLDATAIKETPSFLGEADVVKTLLLNTGVSSVGEGASGFNVRGGDVDQNLILQDDGILLNSSHALGFFSFFNADLIEEVKLYKAIMPAQYGGRLSSVLDVKTREGDFNMFKLKGGAGPVTSRLSLEGPIVKERLSIIAGGRASYADWILHQVKNRDVRESSAFFYDANLKLSAKLGQGSSLILSGYASEDEFRFSDQFGFDYSNQTAQLLLRNVFSGDILSRFSVAYNSYQSGRSDFQLPKSSRLTNRVDYLKAREMLTYAPSTKYRLDGGLSAILYGVEPGEITPLENSTLIGRTVSQERGLEAAIFSNLEYEVTSSLLLSVGLRWSNFRFLGPNTIAQYSNPESPTLSGSIGEKIFGAGETISSNSNFEPRLSLRYRLSDQSSMKMGYSRTVQYINQIFNSDSPTPVSQWQLSNSYIPPNSSHNFSIGYFRYLRDREWKTNAEIYYRSIDKLFDYKDFAKLTANPTLETEILDGIGRSYGFEFSLTKPEGVLNGSLNYTYSTSERQIEGINDGNWYPSVFDKPHDLAFVFNFEPNRRNTLTLNFIYSSGRPTTPPVGNFEYASGLVIPIYANRNAGRIPDYHRLDIAYTIGRGYKRDKKFRTSWTLSLYNVYSRRNALSVFFTQAAQQGAQANKLAILGTIFPSLTFNFEYN